MKAVQINSYGGNDVLEINENASKPSPAKGQVLVEVYATIDHKMENPYFATKSPFVIFTEGVNTSYSFKCFMIGLPFVS